ncbi:hypothetical protein D3C81_1985910 [compost metagenome]
MPFTVFAIRSVGLPCTDGTASSASTKASISFPSMETTFQPKAAHLSSNGSRPITSSVVPLICSRFRSMMPTRLSSL